MNFFIYGVFPHGFVWGGFLNKGVCLVFD